jgi:hypothetical protein
MSCPDWRRLDPAARDASGAPHAAADAAHPIDAIDAIDALHAVHWQQALSHLDTGCPHCWREALAVDPTLIFRRLPAPELTPAQEAEEVEAARLAVAAMRTASRLDSRGDGGTRSASGLLRRRQDRQDGLAIRSLPSLHVHTARWALAAGLTAMALIYGSGHGGWRPTTAATAPVAAAAAAPAGALASGSSPAGSAGSAASAGSAGFESSGSPSTQAAGQAGQDMRAASAFAGWAGASAVQPAASRPSIEGLSRPEARVYQIDSPHMSVVMIVDGKLDV